MFQQLYLSTSTATSLYPTLITFRCALCVSPIAMHCLSMSNFSVSHRSLLCLSNSPWKYLPTVCMEEKLFSVSCFVFEKGWYQALACFTLLCLTVRWTMLVCFTPSYEQCSCFSTEFHRQRNSAPMSFNWWCSTVRGSVSSVCSKKKRRAVCLSSALQHPSSC